MPKLISISDRWLEGRPVVHVDLVLELDEAGDFLRVLDPAATTPAMADLDAARAAAAAAATTVIEPAAKPEKGGRS